MEKKKPITCANLQTQLNKLEEDVQLLVKAMETNSATVAKIIDTLYQKTEKKAVTYFVDNLLKKTNIQDAASLKTFITTIEKVNKGAALAFILKSIALVLDEQYPDNIKNSKELYVFSTLDGKIYKQDPKKVKSYQFFAAFRTLNDAIFAVTMTNKIREFLQHV